MLMPCNFPRVTGFTLIELVVVIVVLSLALTGVTLVINQAVQHSPDALVQTRAMELAQTYLDEIYSKRYDENSGAGGIPRCDSTDTNFKACSNTLGSDSSESNRLLFDDVDDYNGLSEQPPTSIVDGNPLTIYGSYAVQIAVVYAGTELGFASNRHAKRITISITTPLGNTIPVSVYRVNY